MYQPTLFQEERIGVLYHLMRSFPFATIVTSGSHGIEANHLPFVLKVAGTESGHLHGHVARENPLWRSGADSEVLVIFQGPQHYITPSWYPSKKKHGRVVPTWNYAVVHAYGSFHVHDDRAWVHAHLGDLVEQQESGRDNSWAIEDAPDDYIAGMINGIVGFAVSIDRLEGKWKASQNRDETDRSGVINGLKSEGTRYSTEMADLIRS